jgi:hypothetical protein
MEDRMSDRVLKRVLAATAVAACALMSATPALAGNGNAGDVWVDNVVASGPQYGGPGHEMDPHLSCDTNINLWGAKLADPSGGYTIDGWPPSGTGMQTYSSSWNYSGPGSQVIDVIDVQKLVAAAIVNGDVPQANQGFHFKLQFTADPQKHKTFWVNCPGGGNTGGGGGGGGGNTPPPSGGSTPPGVTTSISATKVSIGSVKTLKCRRGTTRGMKRTRGHRHVACVAKRKRHVAAKHRTRRPVVRRDPLFAG